MPLDDPLDSTNEQMAHKDQVDQAGSQIEKLELSRQNWRKLEQSDWGMALLDELSEVCFAGQTLAGSSDAVTNQNVGRHDVWLFVLERLTMDETSILRLIRRNR